MKKRAGNPKRTARQRRPPSAPRETTEEAIRRRAYELYLERQGEPGNAMDDWLEAERQMANHEGPE